MRVVFLDADTVGADADLGPLHRAVAKLEVFGRTEADQINARLAGCDAVIVNKVELGEVHFAANPQLKLVAVIATGVNNIDLEAARRRGVKVVNVTHYGRDSVGQHCFTLILALATRLLDYVADVRAGQWSRSPMFCLMDHPIMELAGKTLGVVGYGDLGEQVARLGRAFGMHVLVAARPGQRAGEVDGHPRLPLSELLPKVDVLSLHCLLSDETRAMINAETLALMPSHAFLINTSRGGLIDEPALADALRQGRIAGAAVDVLSSEPPSPDNPLLAADIPNLIVTPHCAWASREARQRTVDYTADNLLRYQAGALEHFVV